MTRDDLHFPSVSRRWLRRHVWDVLRKVPTVSAMIAAEKQESGVLARDIQKAGFTLFTLGTSAEIHGHHRRATQRARLLWWSLVLRVTANQERPLVYRTGSR